MSEQEQKWVTVATFTYPHELLFLRGRLEAEGIECFTADENTVATDPLVSNAIGGIKLQVREEALEKTMKILDEIREANYEEAASEDAIDGKSQSQAKWLQRGIWILIAAVTVIYIIRSMKNFLNQ